MPGFHAPPKDATHGHERGARALERRSEQVNACRARPVAGEDFEHMARELLHTAFVEADREGVGGRRWSVST